MQPTYYRDQKIGVSVVCGLVGRRGRRGRM